MKDWQGWVRVAAEVLNEQDTERAQQLLSAALLAFPDHAAGEHSSWPRPGGLPPLEDLALAADVRNLVAGLQRYLHGISPSPATARPAGLAPRQARLTPRERAVLQHMVGGATVDGIAARLGISRRTVHKHQEHLYRKLGAVDRLSAVLSAQRLGLLDPAGP